MSKQLFKNIFSLSTVQLVNYVFPLITVPYVSRIIGPDSYGIINYATAFIAYFTLLIGFGFDLTGTRKIARNPDDNQYVNTVFSEVVNARILLFLISCVLFTLCLFFVKPLQNNIYVALIIFATTISSVIVPQFIYQGKQHLSIFAILNFLKGLINTILIFLLIKYKEDYVLLPAINVLVATLSSLFLLVYAYKKFNLRFYWIKFRQILKLLNEEKVIFISTVVISLYTTTNTVVLGLFASTVEVGYFTVSMSLLNVINSVISVPVASAFYPYIGNAFSKDREAGLDVVRKIFPVITFMTFIAGVFLFTFAPLIIHVFYGNQFQNAVTVFRIMAFTPFVISMSNLFGIQTMLNLNMDKIFFKATAVASIFGLIINIFMSKYFSYIGTAWNTIIIESFVSVYMFFLLKNNHIDIIEKKYFNPKYVIIVAKSVFMKNNHSDK
ncbi:MAG: flippase [Paludibacteraceae bacterium]